VRTTGYLRTMRLTLKSLLTASALAGAVATPAAASTVRATYEPTGTRVSLSDPSGERNLLTVSVPSQARRIRFRDTHSPIDVAGKRCTRERPSRVHCPLEGELFFEVEIHAAGGNDRIASDVAARYRETTAAVVHLHGGPGDDRIIARAAEDTIVPGPGRDTVRSGRGYDFISGGPTEDGPDSFDGGRQGATISYAGRESPVSVELDGIANDGAAGEGDDVSRTFGATGGSAADKLIGDRHRNYLFGGADSDRLRGRSGADAVVGEAGSDRLLAGPGPDYVLDRGTAGVDTIDCGPGRDLYEADLRDEVTRCEVPLFGTRAKRAEAAAAAKR
jgi:hypothetical protein